MNKVRFDVLPLPKDMHSRPVDHRGFPVPWFVTNKTQDGLWDFVNIATHRHYEALHKNRCWVSGSPLGVHKAFVVGPMCVVNRVSGEPPVKYEIARWSVKVCPFLTRPMAKRENTSEELAQMQRGKMITRNPGVTAIYVTKTFESYSDGLVSMGEPENVEWYREGRLATREEVIAAMERGLPILEAEAAKERQAKKAQAELARMYRKALELIPDG